VKDVTIDNKENAVAQQSPFKTMVIHLLTTEHHHYNQQHTRSIAFSFQSWLTFSSSSYI